MPLTIAYAERHLVWTIATCGMGLLLYALVTTAELTARSAYDIRLCC